MVLEGVLRKTNGGAIIPEGKRLYAALSSVGQLILVSFDQDEHVTPWLETEGLINHDRLWIAHPAAGLLAEMNYLRAVARYPIDMVVTPQPSDAIELIKGGHNTLLFTHAEYAYPSWRPDTQTGVQPWDEISKQIADAARLKAQDSRMRTKDDN